MKECGKYSKWFSEYIDNDLNIERKQILEQHLHKCSTCKKQIMELDNVKNSLKSMHRIKTSKTFDLLLQSRIRQEIRKSNYKTILPVPSLRLSWRIPAFAAAALFFLMLGAFLYNSYFFKPQVSNSPLTYIQQSQESGLDTGYIFITHIDTSHNFIKVTNYVDMDEFLTMQELIKKRNMLPLENRDNMLPDLREAPLGDNVFMVNQRSKNKPKITPVKEFSF